MKTNRLAVVAVVLVVLAGCTTKTNSAVGNGAPTAVPPAASPTYNPPTDTPTAIPTATDTVSHFGSSGYTWEDGLLVTVSAPVEFTPSESAAGGKGLAAVKFTVTITNNTSKSYDPAMFTTSAQSGTQEADSIYDIDNNLGGSPHTALLPGRTVTFDVGFGVSDPKDVVLQVTPGFDYTPAMFQS